MKSETASDPVETASPRDPAPVVRHYTRPLERPFVRAERGRVTGLIGGLTERHNALILAAAEGLGYRAAAIPTPTKEDYQTGRELCNPGMCNPAYFTIGALINALRRLRDVEGLPVQRILDEYVFVTAGSCGPCRFGMYESEYRLALRNSGFEGFRVLVFQEQGGLGQSGGDAGLELNAAFAQSLITAIAIGDLLNDLAAQIRPYEVIAGQTDRALDAAVGQMAEVLRTRCRTAVKPGLPAKAIGVLGRVLGLRGLGAADVQRILDQVFGDDYVQALAACAATIDASVEVDYTRPKPICRVIGEMWAQMTEGDGNFRMFEFLESQGAEVWIGPLTAWVSYLLDSAAQRNVEVRSAKCEVRSAGGWSRRSFRRVHHSATAWQKWLMLRLALKAIEREYERLRQALGGIPHPLADQAELRDLARPFFNHKITGGEGHLEIGETLYYATRGLAHMVLSVKPFGCMASTQSDGVQPAALAHYARRGYDILFLPVETSGEGDIHAHSRVLMTLADAKRRCADEFETCLLSHGENALTVGKIREYCGRHRALRRPFLRVPERSGVVGRAARFVSYVAVRMADDRRAAQERSCPETAASAAEP